MITKLQKLKLNQFISEHQIEALIITLREQIIEENNGEVFFFGHSLNNFQLNKLNNHLEKNKKSITVGSYLKKMVSDRGIFSVSDDTFGDALINKAYWSKLINDKIVVHDKDKLIRIAITLKLSLSETMNLLQKAGYTLSENNDKDIVISFCIKECIYNLQDIEELLEERKLRSLFSNVRFIEQK